MLAFSTHHAHLAESSFPHTLSAALKLAGTVMPFSDDDELSFVLTEYYECEYEGRLCSAEIDQQRWGFRWLNSKWLLTYVQAPWAEMDSELDLLRHQFNDFIASQHSAADRLFVYDSPELALTHFAFGYPIEENRVLYTYLPKDILDASLVEASRLGYSIER